MVEPIAWLYTREDEAPVFLREQLRGNTLRSATGWTETPLYGPEALAARDARIATNFHDRVHDWMLACFGIEIAADKLERTDRFIEEALELAQTNPDFTADRAHALVDYVFGRPVGDTFQEVGGVRLTLAALCNASDINENDAVETELARVWTKVDQIRAKQAAKPVGSALPQALETKHG